MKFNVTGMSCAACSARVEKAVSAVEGVSYCSVNFLTNSMVVEGTAKKESIIEAVISAGYGVSDKQDGDKIKSNKISKGKTHLILSIIFVLIITRSSCSELCFSTQSLRMQTL